MSTSEKLRVRLRFEYFTAGDASRTCTRAWHADGRPHGESDHPADPSSWRHVVYEASDPSGAMLYVGRTRDLTRRLRSHRLRAPWWPQVASITASFMPCLQQTVAYEELRIRHLAPPYNQRGGSFTTTGPWRAAS